MESIQTVWKIWPATSEIQINQHRSPLQNCWMSNLGSFIYGPDALKDTHKYDILNELSGFENINGIYISFVLPALHPIFLAYLRSKVFTAIRLFHHIH